MLGAMVASAALPHDEARQTDRPARSLQAQVDSLVRGKAATIGVAIDYEGKPVCRVNGTRAFPMMSVYKLHQAVAVMDSLRRGSLMRLNTEVMLTPRMLRKDTYSPLRDRYPEGGVALRVDELLRYSLWMSDNNACDILFSLFGGTAYVSRRMEEWGLRHTQVRWTEDEMHQWPSRCADNSTTPDDALLLLRRAVADDWLRDCLVACQTGRGRIPGQLPEDTPVGHKTGTGDASPDGTLHGVNDIGWVVLPDGSRFFIAVFCDDSRMTMQQTEATIAEIARRAYDCLCPSVSRP